MPAAGPGPTRPVLPWPLPPAGAGSLGLCACTLPPPSSRPRRARGARHGRRGPLGAAFLVSWPGRARPRGTGRPRRSLPPPRRAPEAAGPGFGSGLQRSVGPGGRWRPGLGHSPARRGAATAGTRSPAPASGRPRVRPAPRWALPRCRTCVRAGGTGPESSSSRASTGALGKQRPSGLDVRIPQVVPGS